MAVAENGGRKSSNLDCRCNRILVRSVPPLITIKKTITSIRLLLFPRCSSVPSDCSPPSTTLLNVSTILPVCSLSPPSATLSPFFQHPHHRARTVNQVQTLSDSFYVIAVHNVPSVEQRNPCSLRFQHHLSCLLPHSK